MSHCSLPPTIPQRFFTRSPPIATHQQPLRCRGSHVGRGRCAVRRRHDQHPWRRQAGCGGGGTRSGADQPAGNGARGAPRGRGASQPLRCLSLQEERLLTAGSLPDNMRTILFPSFDLRVTGRQHSSAGGRRWQATRSALWLPPCEPLALPDACLDPVASLRFALQPLRWQLRAHRRTILHPGLAPKP